MVSLINLTRDEMLAACDNFYKLLSSGVYGVFYFAGHGFESAGENYLVCNRNQSEISTILWHIYSIILICYFD